jgi:hypothetical protein
MCGNMNKIAATDCALLAAKSLFLVSRFYRGRKPRAGCSNLSHFAGPVQTEGLDPVLVGCPLVGSFPYSV